jgi:hypothetical protein
MSLAVTKLAHMVLSAAVRAALAGYRVAIGYAAFDPLQTSRQRRRGCRLRLVADLGEARVAAQQSPLARSSDMFGPSENV